MYVVVVYDADAAERENLRSILMPRLHWIQNSVFAGEMTRRAAEYLIRAIEAQVHRARVTFWLFDRRPKTHRMGTQDDRESIFL
jgi:CRISPR-associated protein Cas2